jgi:hypothetical protein
LRGHLLLLNGYLACAPNKPLELTPLRVERDRSDFEGKFPLEGFPDLQGGAAQRQVVRRQSIKACSR